MRCKTALWLVWLTFQKCLLSTCQMYFSRRRYAWPDEDWPQIGLIRVCCCCCLNLAEPELLCDMRFAYMKAWLNADREFFPCWVLVRTCQQHLCLEKNKTTRLRQRIWCKSMAVLREHCVIYFGSNQPVLPNIAKGFCMIDHSSASCLGLGLKTACFGTNPGHWNTNAAAEQKVCVCSHCL